jgi:capsular polysaccharide biosynthesis protein
LYDLRLGERGHGESGGGELKKPPVFEQVSNGEHSSLSVKEFLRIVRRQIWFIILVMLLVAGSALGFSLLMTPMYEGSIKLLVGQPPPTIEPNSPYPPVADAFGLQQITRTMAEGLQSESVAEDVIRRLDLSMTPEEFVDNYLSVSQIQQTQYIDVTYRDPSPERAQQVADAIGDVFTEQVSDVNLSVYNLQVSVWQQAEVPDEPVSPNLLLNILVALILGLMLGTGLAFLLEYLDDSWRSPEEAEQISGVPTFGAIPEFKATTAKKGD